jgi:hypothetical protein
VSLLAAVALAAAATGRPPSRFTRDPAALLGSHPLLGVVSNVGVLLWAAAAAVSLFAAVVLRGDRHDDPRGAFLLYGGLVTSWLALDDLFLVHEWLAPSVFAVPQPVVLLAYAGVVAALLLRFGPVIRSTEYELLLLALTLFAASAAMDQLPQAWFAWDSLFLIEDGLKLLGIVSWLGYFGSTGVHILARRPPSPK